MESGADTDPEQAIERDTQNLEEDLDRLEDRIGEAKSQAADRAKEAEGKEVGTGDDPSGADEEES